MKKKFLKTCIAAVCFLAVFVLWTMLVRTVDVKPIASDGSTVGFATLNEYVHGMTGVSMTLYTVTDWLGLIPFFTALGFGVLGLVQWIRRRSLLLVDHSILILGFFYIAVIAVYLLFESVVINVRPILIGGIAEASYPSSTTMLVLCVMPTAMMQLYPRIRHIACRQWLMRLIGVFTAFFILSEAEENEPTRPKSITTNLIGKI